MAVPELFDSLLLVPLTFLALLPLVVYIVHEIIDGTISFPVGLTVLTFSIAVLVGGILIKDERITFVVLASFVTALPAFHFARMLFERQEHRLQDVDDLGRVYLAAVQRPDDIGTLFRVAGLLYKWRLSGPAIAIASFAASKISERADSTSSPSPRDFFRSELSQLEDWRRQSPHAIEPVECLRCKHKNPPHILLCERCNAPFLLDHVRVKGAKANLVPKILFAWMLLTSVLLLSVWLSRHLGREPLLLTVLGLAVVTGLILRAPFRPLDLD